MTVTINKPELSTYGLLNTPEAKRCKVGDILVANGEKYERIDARKNAGNAWKIVK